MNLGDHFYARFHQLKIIIIIIIINVVQTSERERDVFL